LSGVGATKARLSTMIRAPYMETGKSAKRMLRLDADGTPKRKNARTPGNLPSTLRHERAAARQAQELIESATSALQTIMNSPKLIQAAASGGRLG